MNRECKKHGIVKHYQRKVRKDGWKCSICNTEQQRAFKNRKKDLLIEKAGGKCCKCGYNRCTQALQFHHLRDKKFELRKSVIGTKTNNEILEELKKCILVCANCHAEIHANIMPG